MFGIVDTQYTLALGYIEIVPNREAATLLPIIQSNVQRGSIIHSDELASYRRVASIPGVTAHGTVNHSIEFNPTTSVHTQHVESYWNRVKTKFKRMKGVQHHQLPSYLDEFMWRGRKGRTHRDAVGGIIDEITAQYPVH